MYLDEALLETLFIEYSPRLTSYARKFLAEQSLAEDVVQESFVRLWEGYHGTSEEKWQSILFAIVRNRCIDQLRHLALQHRFLLNADSIRHAEELLYAEDMSVNGAADYKTVWEDLNSRIQAVLAKLPERSREVFIMSRFQGLKNKEIAERLGISEKTVEKHMTKALTGFRKGLSASGIDPHLMSLVFSMVFFS